MNRNNLSCSEQDLSLAKVPCAHLSLSQGKSLTGRYLGLSESLHRSSIRRLLRMGQTNLYPKLLIHCMIEVMAYQVSIRTVRKMTPRKDLLYTLFGTLPP